MKGDIPKQFENLEKIKKEFYELPITKDFKDKPLFPKHEKDPKKDKKLNFFMEKKGAGDLGRKVDETKSLQGFKNNPLKGWTRPYDPTLIGGCPLNHGYLAERLRELEAMAMPEKVIRPGTEAKFVTREEEPKLFCTLLEIYRGCSRCPWLRYDSLIQRFKGAFTPPFKPEEKKVTLYSDLLKDKGKI